MPAAPAGSERRASIPLLVVSPVAAPQELLDDQLTGVRDVPRRHRLCHLGVPPPDRVDDHAVLADGGLEPTRNVVVITTWKGAIGGPEEPACPLGVGRMVDDRV